MGSKTLRGDRQEYAPNEDAIQRDGGRTHGDWKGVEHGASQLLGAYPEAPKGQRCKRPSARIDCLLKENTDLKGTGSRLGGEVEGSGGIDSGSL